MPGPSGKARSAARGAVHLAWGMINVGWGERSTTCGLLDAISYMRCTIYDILHGHALA